MVEDKIRQKIKIYYKKQLGRRLKEKEITECYYSLFYLVRTIARYLSIRNDIVSI